MRERIQIRNGCRSSGTISIVLRRLGGRAIDAPATAQRGVLVLGAIVDTLKGLGLSWRSCCDDQEIAMDDLFQLAQLALVVVFGAGILVAGRLFMRR